MSKAQRKWPKQKSIIVRLEADAHVEILEGLLKRAGFAKVLNRWGGERMLAVYGWDKWTNFDFAEDFDQGWQVLPLDYGWFDTMVIGGRKTIGSTRAINLWTPFLAECGL